MAVWISPWQISDEPTFWQRARWQYSTFSFTFKAADTDTCIEYRVRDISAGYLDPSVLKETVVIKAGETKTFTFDCSNSKGVGLEIKENGTIGVFSEGWITNITFS